jgi:type IV secretion system protein TrbF
MFSGANCDAQLANEEKTMSAEVKQRAGEANPYLDARRSWNEHVGSVVSSRQAWQVTGMLSLLVALASVGGMVYIGSQSKFVPYVVEVDKLGQAAAVRSAQTAEPTNERVIHAYLAAFVNDARQVTPDIALQRAAIFRVYALLSGNDPATVEMNQFLNGNPEANPFKRAEQETVAVQIESVMRQTPESWQVDWLETVHDRQGAVKTPPFHMRALLSVYLVPPTAATTEEQLRRNPLGVYIKDFRWSKQN